MTDTFYEVQEQIVLFFGAFEEIAKIEDEKRRDEIITQMSPALSSTMKAFDVIEVKNLIQKLRVIQSRARTHG